MSKNFKFDATEESILVLNGKDNEILRFEPDGGIFLYGRKVENDKEVVDGFREFLKESGFLHSVD
jgi:hypothetical protein